MSQREVITEKIAKKQETLTSLELQLLGNGFMPDLKLTPRARLELYQTYLLNSYQQNIHLTSHDRIMYKCMYDVISNLLDNYS